MEFITVLVVVNVEIEMTKKKSIVLFSFDRMAQCLLADGKTLFKSSGLSKLFVDLVV